MTIDSDFIVEAARASPATAVTGLTLAGVALSEWVVILTLILLVFQLFFLVRDKWYIPRKHKRSNYGRNGQ